VWSTAEGEGIMETLGCGEFNQHPWSKSAVCQLAEMGAEDRTTLGGEVVND
jgi:hypothetical protein